MRPSAAPHPSGLPRAIRRPRNQRRPPRPDQDDARPAPSLTPHDAPGRPRGLVLVLHGGKARSTRRGRRGAACPGAGPRWMRDPRRPAARRAASASGCCATASAAGTATAPAQIADARWALDAGAPRARRRARSCCSATRWAGARPCRVADDPHVRRRRRARALAARRASRSPRWPASSSHAAHGRRDQITVARRHRAFVERARRGRRARRRSPTWAAVGHYLLRGIRRLERLRRRAGSLGPAERCRRVPDRTSG